MYDLLLTFDGLLWAELVRPHRKEDNQHRHDLNSMRTMHMKIMACLHVETSCHETHSTLGHVTLTFHLAPGLQWLFTHNSYYGISTQLQSRPLHKSARLESEKMLLSLR